MRTLIALNIPEEFADDVAALARMLSASMEGRFLARDTYHLTLAFLGDIDDAEQSRNPHPLQKHPRPRGRHLQTTVPEGTRLQCSNNQGSIVVLPL